MTSVATTYAPCTPCAAVPTQVVAAPVVGGGPMVASAPSYIAAPMMAPAPIAVPSFGTAYVAPSGPPPEPMVFPSLTASGGGPLPSGAPAPGETTPVAPEVPAKIGTAAWLNAWPQAAARLQQMGMPQLVIDAIGAQPMNVPELEQAVRDAELALRGGQQSQVLVPLTPGGAADTTQPVPGRQAGSVPATPQQPEAAKQAEIAEVEQIAKRHISAGMPEELVTMFAEAATSARGLDAALNQIDDRMQRFTEAGWTEKFEQAGAKPLDIWSVLLGGDPLAGTMLGPMPSDRKLEEALVTAQRAKAGLGRQVAEAVVSLVPGVQAAEYVAGKNVISGSDIRRDTGINQLLAGVSAAALGVVALGKFRNVKSLMAGLTSARQGYSGLTQATGRALAEGSQGAKLTQLATSGKLSLPKAYFNKELRNGLIGMGHLDAAAKARIAQGASLDTFGRTITDDVLGRAVDGDLAATIGKLSTTKRMPGSKPGAMGTTTHQTAELSDGAIKFNSKLKISNGVSQLAGTVKAGGDRIGSGTGYLADRLPALHARVDDLSVAERNGVGEALAGSVLAGTGKAARDGAPARDLNKLLVQDRSTPALAWLREALTSTQG